MKKLDPIKKVVIERHAFVNNKLNTNHQALSAASRACLGPRIVLFVLGDNVAMPPTDIKL